MKLIVGLGNPGIKYQNSLHNIGFMFIDYYLNKMKKYSIEEKEKYKSLIYNLKLDHYSAIFLKPQTYMNLSGHAVKNIMNFYKISLEDILIISDDIYLKEGFFKLKSKGGHGGHNGLRNIIDVLQTNKFKRLKIGVDQDNSKSLEQYLLSSIDDHKKQIITQSFFFIENIVTKFIKCICWEKLFDI